VVSEILISTTEILAMLAGLNARHFYEFLTIFLMN